MKIFFASVGVAALFVLLFFRPINAQTNQKAQPVQSAPLKPSSEELWELRALEQGIAAKNSDLLTLQEEQKLLELQKQLLQQQMQKRIGEIREKHKWPKTAVWNSQDSQFVEKP